MNKKIKTGLCLLALLCLLAGCRSQQNAAVSENTAASENQSALKDKVASGEETVAAVPVLEEGMEPVYGDQIVDGTYSIKVDSSSSMFNITECTLHAQEGKLTAVMTMSGDGYTKLFLGSGEEAASADEGFIDAQVTDEGVCQFTIPVEGLNMEIDCSAFSRRKEKWYQRVLVFRADSLPQEAWKEGTLQTPESLGLADGDYTVEVQLGGGSGRASIQSPAALQIDEGKAWATIVWSSANYDYMRVGGEIYRWSGQGEYSSFTIPVEYFDRSIQVTADTIAMSQPYEIEYTLTFDSASINRAGQEETGEKNQENGETIPLLYASQFSMERFSDGNTAIHVADGGEYLVVPEGGKIPEELSQEVTVISLPLDNIYLAATSAMDLFNHLDSLDQITLSGTEASGWYIEEARQAMEEGRMVYAGKYSGPDYEKILSAGCDLAIESTMINHSPQVKEQLTRLGIPVFVERSSYESHPLGRMEWIKVYGVLTGKEELADACFQAQLQQLEEIFDQENTGKTVAFFSIHSKGYATVRKSGDYVAKMIELAGGKYVPEGLGNDNQLSTMNMEMEAFYEAAKDADYLIYNSTIDGELSSLGQLLEKSSLFGDFKAVKEGNVWCAKQNMFQETMSFGEMIQDIHRMLTKEGADDEDMAFLLRLE